VTGAHTNRYGDRVGDPGDVVSTARSPSLTLVKPYALANHTWTISSRGIEDWWIARAPSGEMWTVSMRNGEATTANEMWPSHYERSLSEDY